MDLPLIVAGIGLLLFIAKFSEDLVLKIGFPGLLGPITAGMILSGTWLRDEYHASPFVFVVGLSFTAFLLGAEELGMRIEEVTNRQRLIKGIILFTVPFIIAMAILVNFMSLRLSALLASIIAMTSTTRIYSLLKHAGEHIDEETFSARELPLSIIMALIISVGYLSELIGGNSAAVALLLGILSSEYLAERPWIKKRLRIITHSFFEPLFFIGTGLGITLGIVPNTLLVLLLVNFLSAVIKFYIGLRMGWNRKQSLATAVKGGVDSALLAAAWRKGAISTPLFSSALIVITLNTYALAWFFRGEKKKGYLKVCNLELDRAAVDLSEPLKNVVEMLKDRSAVVVVDALNWPIGYVSALDIISIPKDELDKMNVYDVYHDSVPVMKCDDPINKIVLLAEDLEESQVIAVVKEYIGYVGSLYPVKMLKYLEYI